MLLIWLGLDLLHRSLFSIYAIWFFISLSFSLSALRIISFINVFFFLLVYMLVCLFCYLVDAFRFIVYIINWALSSDINHFTYSIRTLKFYTSMSIMFWMITAQILYTAYENFRDKLRLWMLNSFQEDLEHTYLIWTKIELLEVNLKVCFGLFLICS